MTQNLCLLLSRFASESSCDDLNFLPSPDWRNAEAQIQYVQLSHQGAVAHSEEVLTQMRGEGKKINQARSFIAQFFERSLFWMSGKKVVNLAGKT